jgi:serine/threonine protein kinase
VTQLGRFELVRLLAKGGMADIYVARQVGVGQFEREVAVKVLNSQRACDPEARELFLDEARLLAMLHHHNLATVFEVDIADDALYLAMELVEGADVRELMAAASRKHVGIPFDTALSIVAQAAAGLDHAHRRCAPDGRPLHLVHRDVSLSNIMVGHDGTVKVVDFGIATATISSHVTNPGVVRGKSSYMSPEQCLGDAVDLRTDVFALGVVLYELATGKRCFHGASDFERMLAVVRGDFVPPSLAVAGFPDELERVILTALANNPEHRYPSAAALIAALEEVAASYGWVLGVATVTRTMQELLAPATPADGSDAGLDERTEVTPEPDLPLPDPTVVLTRPRRFPRGTEGNPRIARDDEPTRGRRSAPRLWCRRSAA